jgi:hypothetical protein
MRVRMGMSKQPRSQDTDLLLPKLEDSDDGVRSAVMCGPQDSQPQGR